MDVIQSAIVTTMVRSDTRCGRRVPVGARGAKTGASRTCGNRLQRGPREVLWDEATDQAIRASADPCLAEVILITWQLPRAVTTKLPTMVLDELHLLYSDLMVGGSKRSRPRRKLMVPSISGAGRWQARCSKCGGRYDVDPKWLRAEQESARTRGEDYYLTR